MKNGLLAGSAATVGVGLLANTASAQERGRLNPGDTAILRFLAAAELIEADLWTQYAELGGIGKDQPIEINPNPNPALNNYQIALSNLDSDGPCARSPNLFPGKAVRIPASRRVPAVASVSAGITQHPEQIPRRGWLPGKNLFKLF
jgi:hypothetical protein